MVTAPAGRPGLEADQMVGMHAKLSALGFIGFTHEVQEAGKQLAASASCQSMVMVMVGNEGGLWRGDTLKLCSVF